MSFWRMPWNRSIGPIGLDLGAGSPRAMQVRHGPDGARRLIEVDVEPSDDLARRAARSAQALRRAGFIGREIVVGLPTSVTRMHVARMPAVLGEHAASAIAWEASQRTEIPNERIVADAIPTGAPSQHGDGKEEQLVVAADADEVGRALDALMDGGFEPIAAEPRFMSVARAASRRARREADAGNVRAILHVEQEGSIILVVRGDRVAFCREVAVGGETLDRAVATRLSVTAEEAAALRAHRIASVRGAAEPVDAVADEAALAATRATIESLANEVALCLRYYGVTFRGGQPGRVVMSGPHGSEPRLAQIVGEMTRAEVGAIDEELPKHALESMRAAAPGADVHAWIAAFGLACHARNEHGSASPKQRSAA